MEPLFEAEGVLNKELYTRLQLAAFRENKTQVLAYVMAGVLFLLALISAATEALIAFALCVVAGIFLLLLPKISIGSAVRQLEEKTCVHFNHPFTVRFFENEMIEFTPYTETRVPYTMLHHVLETERDLFIFTGPAQAVCIPKSVIKRGSPQVLVRFLREYRGVPYKSV